MKTSRLATGAMLLAAAWLALQPGNARAQGDDEARATFKQGVELYQAGKFEEVLRFRGYWAIPILHFFDNLVNVGFRMCKPDLFVERQLLGGRGNVSVGDEAVHFKFCSRHQQLFRFLSSQFSHRLFEKLTVHLETDGCNVSMLLRA